MEILTAIAIILGLGLVFLKMMFDFRNSEKEYNKQIKEIENEQALRKQQYEFKLETIRNGNIEITKSFFELQSKLIEDNNTCELKTKKTVSSTLAIALLILAMRLR